MANIALSGMSSSVAGQFSGLRGRHPGLWPWFPRAALLVAVFGVVLLLGWIFFWQMQIDSLEAGVAQEKQLRAAYVDKVRQAINLDVLKRQREQVLAFVTRLERQLPSKAEMDALLSDINQAGVSRGLQFDLFKPGQVIARDFYAELPINVRLSGRFNDLASFVSDISNLPRIVTLNNIQISAGDKPGSGLSLEAIAKTFRYLDAEEIDLVRRETKGQSGNRTGGQK